MRRLASLSAALALVPLGRPAAGPIEEVRGGVLLQGVGPFSPDKEDGVGINAEVLFKRLEALKFIGSPRPQVGVHAATGKHATSSVYAGFNWDVEITPWLFIDGGVALAAHDGEVSFDPADPLIGERNFLGCRVLARLSADLGVEIAPRVTVSLHADHMSNAGLCSENEGLDSVGVRLGVKL
ncbi:MAG: acyloxyacyl hydrolase [Parvularculaceae bacterium]|nr:acyloxyacyl hydrolase [Parvularculaceae bacterium]